MATSKRITKTANNALQHARAIGDLAAQIRRYIDDQSQIADTYPAQVRVMRLMLDECSKRAGALIDLAD